MKENVEIIKNSLKDNPDLVIKKCPINFFSCTYIIFLETLVNQDKINNYILKHLSKINIFNKNLIPGANEKEILLNEWEHYIYMGYTLVLYKKHIYAIETRAEISRSVSTNETEPSIKGPKNAFVENFQTNLGLIKRRVKTSKLKIKSLTLGKISNTAVGLVYLEDKCKEDLINDVHNRLLQNKNEIINDVHDLNKLLGGSNLFPTVLATERPDRCAKALSEGKIVIIADESSNALIIPSTLNDFINPFSDIYNKKFNILFTKIIRYLCFFLSAIVPAFYIAIINYNQEAIPTSLIINFAIQRSGIPFPAVIECVMMLIICEILRESDLRFPNKYGSAISILGALVLGDAAVSAGLVSPIMIIITAFTYISSLIFAEIEIGNALRVFRFIFLALSSFLGLYGLLIAVCFLIIYLSDTTSLNYPYLGGKK